MDKTGKSDKNNPAEAPLLNTVKVAGAGAAAGASAGTASYVLWGMSRDGSTQADVWMAANGELLRVERDEEGVIQAVRVDTDQDGKDERLFEQPPAPEESSASDSLEVRAATGVTDQMSFSEAFAAARQEAGPGGVFAWRGQVYGTFYKEEWESLTPARQAARYEQVSRYVAENPLPEPDAPVFYVSISQEPATPPEAAAPEMEVVGHADLSGDGIPDAILVDTNADGRADMVFMDQNQDGIVETVAVDENFDGQIDAIHPIDGQSGRVTDFRGQIPGSGEASDPTAGISPDFNNEADVSGW